MCGDSAVVRTLLKRSGWRQEISHKRNVALGALGFLCALMLAVGIYYKQFFVVFVFCVWLCAEALLLRLQPLLKWAPRRKISGHETFEEDSLWKLFEEASENSHTICSIKISERLGLENNEKSRRWNLAFKNLLDLKLLLDSPQELRGKKGLQQALLFKASSRKELCDSQRHLEIKNINDICEAAMIISELLNRTLSIAETEESRVGEEARGLLENVLGFPFDSLRSRAFIEKLTDALHRNSGAPFLILNLLSRGRYFQARELGRAVLADEVEVSEDLKSTLYWVAEVDWFSKKKKDEILEHDTAIKHLYHLCFTNPDRAGILEIDSQFSSEFGPVNEIIEEGFLFKETLVEALLELWKDYEGWFDGVFQTSLEAMTGRKSKIFDERANWERYWRQEKEQFSRDYLYVVEGNLSYASGQVKDAQYCYERALAISPKLRSAIFNLLMVSAELKDHKTHERIKNLILEEAEWMPLALSSIANSFVLLNDDKKALEYYSELKTHRGWERKTEFYLSVFCFDRGYFDKALTYAIKASELNPSDTSVSFHLSRCYSVLGEKEAALQAFKRSQGPTATEIAPRHTSWLNFYQFTLERDSGRCEEAVQTLMKIPKDYFQDPEELKQAVDFAKDINDFSLLRHLKP
ncbi:MAG: tetratricopeptide repeat protein [Proteobacteria bacterium]|nr:tetratricopeptide repeat protein [Pseudomonadota bacterium]